MVIGKRSKCWRNAGQMPGEFLDQTGLSISPVVVENIVELVVQIPLLCRERFLKSVGQCVEPRSIVPEANHSVEALGVVNQLVSAAGRRQRSNRDNCRASGPLSQEATAGCSLHHRPVLQPQPLAKRIGSTRLALQSWQGYIAPT